MDSVRFEPVDKKSSLSRIQIHGPQVQPCGYCDQKPLETSESYGITSDHMSTDDYQSLMLQGWRRAGTYFYKPVMHKSCCPAYTIRLKTSAFKPSKSLRKVLKNIETFLSQSKTDARSDSGSTNTAMSLSIVTEPSSFTDEKFELYKRYQISIHHDEPSKLTPKSFTRFLVESPLFDPANIAKRKRAISNGAEEVDTIPSDFGSYHQLYRLNDLLIAVGVIDILPSGISSVYFFYDPVYKHLVLGKYSVSKEIEFCQEIQRRNKQQTAAEDDCEQYYYMGFYIHDCEKMRYKGEYRPSELLCPTSFIWRPIEECIPLLDRFLFTPLREDLAIQRASLGGVEKHKATKHGCNSKHKECSNQDNESKEETSAIQSSEQHSTDISNDTNEDNTSHADLISETVVDTTSDVNAEVDLSIFAPTISIHTNSNTSSNSRAFTINNIRMDIGAGQYIYLSQLRANDIKVIGPLFEEWFAVSGADVNRNIVICFNQ